MDDPRPDTRLAFATHTASSDTRSKPEGSHKRARLTSELGTSNESSQPLKPCHFQTLPLELLAEILIYTESPADVLAVARSSKFFCDTLTNPSSSFIWRKMRLACQPEPPPEPISTFTESSYAAFVFDEGICEVCEKRTHSMYTSFALRLRLCKNNACLDYFLSSQCASQAKISRVWGGFVDPQQTEKNKAILKCIPVAEFGLQDCEKFTCRQSDYKAEEIELLKSSVEEYIIKNKTRAKYMTVFMDFCTALHKWKKLREASYKSIKILNEISGQSLATQHGWRYWDLVNFTPYGKLHRHQCKMLQLVTPRDYDPLLPAIEKSLLDVSEKRTRRAHEARYKQNRADVSRYYDQLRGQHEGNVYPSLLAFRKLPMVVMLQAPQLGGPKFDLAETHHSAWIQEKVEADVQTWIEQAKTHLGATLGFPDWKTASTTTLHPVERLTARFQCRYCPKLARRYLNDGCMDFAGVCAHRCSSSKGKAKKRLDETWDATRFVKDDKAINAMSNLVALCHADVTRKYSYDMVRSVGEVVMCMSCQPAVVVGFENIIGHSHRHDNMQISSILPATISNLIYPIDHGLTQRLMNHDHEKVSLQNYGCRHCSPMFKVTGRLDSELHSGLNGNQTHVGETAQASEGGNRKKKSPIGPFNFNGLRSHLSAKHNINDNTSGWILFLRFGSEDLPHLLGPRIGNVNSDRLLSFVTSEAMPYNLFDAHATPHPLCLGNCYHAGIGRVPEDATWAKLEGTDVLRALLFNCIGDRLVEKVIETLKLVANGDSEMLTLVSIAEYHDALSSPMPSLVFGQKMRKLLTEHDFDIKSLYDLASHYMTHILIAMYNPPGPSPQVSVDPTPNTKRLEDIESLLENVRKARNYDPKELKAIVCLGYSEASNGIEFKGVLRGIVSHIFPFAMLNKVPISIEALEIFGNFDDLTDYIRKWLNDPLNLILLETNVHTGFDTLAWSIEAVQNHSNGPWTYYMRTLRPDMGAPWLKKDGDILPFGKALREALSDNPDAIKKFLEGNHFSQDLDWHPISPNPRFCNLHLAVARTLHMCGAAEVFARMEDEYGDGDRFDLTCRRPLVPTIPVPGLGFHSELDTYFIEQVNCHLLRGNMNVRDPHAMYTT